MPSVPLAKDAPAPTSICPHATKLLSHANGDTKLRDGLFPLNGVDKPHVAKDAVEALNAKNPAAERKWIRPDLPSRCKWSLGASKADSPHAEVPR